MVIAFADAEPKKVGRPPSGKKSLSLRVDGDVLEFFRAMGDGYLQVMNDVLRKHMEETRQVTPLPKATAKKKKSR